MLGKSEELALLVGNRERVFFLPFRVVVFECCRPSLAVARGVLPSANPHHARTIVIRLCPVPPPPGQWAS